MESLKCAVLGDLMPCSLVTRSSETSVHVCQNTRPQIPPDGDLDIHRPKYLSAHLWRTGFSSQFSSSQCAHRTLILTFRFKYSVIRRLLILLTADENMLCVHSRVLYYDIIFLYMYTHTHTHTHTDASLLCSDLNFVSTVRMPNYIASWIRQQDASSDIFCNSKTWSNAGIPSLCSEFRFVRDSLHYEHVMMIMCVLTQQTLQMY